MPAAAQKMSGKAATAVQQPGQAVVGGRLHALLCRSTPSWNRQRFMDFFHAEKC